MFCQNTTHLSCKDNTRQTASLERQLIRLFCMNNVDSDHCYGTNHSCKDYCVGGCKCACVRVGVREKNTFKTCLKSIPSHGVRRHELVVSTPSWLHWPTSALVLPVSAGTNIRSRRWPGNYPNWITLETYKKICWHKVHILSRSVFESSHRSPGIQRILVDLTYVLPWWKHFPATGTVG